MSRILPFRCNQQIVSVIKGFFSHLQIKVEMHSIQDEMEINFNPRQKKNPFSSTKNSPSICILVVLAHHMLTNDKIFIAIKFLIVLELIIVVDTVTCRRWCNFLLRLTCYRCNFPLILLSQLFYFVLRKEWEGSVCFNFNFNWFFFSSHHCFQFVSDLWRKEDSKLWNWRGIQLFTFHERVGYWQMQRWSEL